MLKTLKKIPVNGVRKALTFFRTYFMFHRKKDIYNYIILFL